ncbi:MAG: hypothetical protein D6682_06830 [Zetaproteobacteria bacterium]|nr:MAG: hypothetical protein D6682_06830 [Zetaproteobacteria bacterium]
MSVDWGNLPPSTALHHGGAVEAAARGWGCTAEEILDLSTGIHPDGPPRWLSSWLGEHADLAGRHPDPEGEPARSALARAFDVEPACLLVGAGARSFIELLPQAMGWRSLALECPCYSQPLHCARRAGCRILPFRRGGAIPRAEAFWLTSPHNPDGAPRPLPTAGGGVLDESYMAWEKRCRLGIIPGVVRLGSLTKLFALPGLPAGYLVAEPQLLERIRPWLPPWGAATPLLHLVPRLLAEAEARDGVVACARRRLERLLTTHGWRTLPSEAPFLLGRPPSKRFPPFHRHRILVRTFPEWPELTGWVRLGLPGDEEGWVRLAAALDARADEGDPPLAERSAPAATPPRESIITATQIRKLQTQLTDL